MTDWSRVPVVVGAGQVTSREQDPLAAPSPFDLMEAVAAEAAEAASARGGDGKALLAGLTHLFMVHSLSLRHGEPARALAERLGATGAEARTSGMGGNIPQWLVNRAAELVVEGKRPRVLVVGAEALATRKRAKQAGIELEWPTSEGWPDTWPPLEADLGVHKVERAHGLDQATTMYALVESALAHEAGHDPSAHGAAMGRLMAGLNEVAAANPLSWFPTRRSAEEIATPSSDNRMISFPYPKYVNAVMDVDMGAAVLVTDAATARQWGLGPQEVAYLSGWADTTDIWYLSERPQVHRAPALAAGSREALAMAVLGTDEIAAFDLYSCFPSSIEVACHSLGIDPHHDRRPLTLTGGLPYHGGPGSNYVTHAVANALERVRTADDEHVLVHGNGYYLTKHAVGVYSSRPPSAAPSPDGDLQQRLEATFSPRPVERRVSGPGTIVAATVPFGRHGEPQEAILLLEVDGARTLALAGEALTETMLSTDAVGTAVKVTEGEERAPNRASAA